MQNRSGQSRHGASAFHTILRKLPLSSSSFDCNVGNCFIRNLCVDAEGEYVYFKGSQHDTRALKALHLHPNARSNIRSRMLHVKVVDGLIDEKRFRVVDDGVHVAIDRLYIPYKQGAPNIGHTLGDEVVSIFRALVQWELIHEPVYVYLNDLTLIDVYSILRLARAPQLRSTISRSTCFRRFLVGWAHLGFMVSAQPSYLPPPVPKLELLHFRKFAWKRFNVTSLPWHHTRVRIAILQKNFLSSHHRSTIANTAAIAARLERDFDAHVTSFGWQGMPIAEQVQRMSQTDVLITLPGSDLMNAVFMPTRSALIVPFRHVGNTTSSNFAGRWLPSNELRLWYKYLPFRKIIEYNPGEDGESTCDYAGHITLGLNALSRRVQEAIVHLVHQRAITHQRPIGLDSSISALALRDTAEGVDVE